MAADNADNAGSSPTEPSEVDADLAEALDRATARTGYHLLVSGMGPFPAPTDLYRAPRVIQWLRRYARASGT